MKRFVWLSLLLAAGCLEPTPKPAGEAAPVPSVSSSTPVPTAPTPTAGNIVMPGGPGGGVVTGDIGALAAPAANNTTSPQTPATSADPKDGFGKQPAKLVDLNEAKQNPKVVVVTGKIMADDPLTAAAQAYFSLQARAQIANFQNQVRISKELNDGKPLNHSQFMELVQQLRIEFLPLPPWQMLGYDSKSGDIVVLEDKGEKIRLFKERSIPIDDVDKAFE